MSQLLDLQVEIAERPPDASAETAAPITLRCKALKLEHDEGMFSYPLTKNERDDLRWYLEDYWKWPFEGFAQRGSTVEQLLPVLGQRLYQAAFAQGVARDILQQWRANTSGTHQISIITTDAGFLSLPWELLHDGQDFLALQANPPISIVRRIAEEQQPSPSEATFEKPLRVLLVTARPVDEGQVDVRTIAREVVDVLQEQREAGTIELEFLRPPTFDKLSERLSEKGRPVHVLHFDGHGVFYRLSGSQNGNDVERSRLFFEKEDGKGDAVDAVSSAEVLRYGSVQVAILNACQSAAIGEKDISSSVAVQLLQGGIQAVVAMSASILTTGAALYVKAFYAALAAGGSIQAAHEQAQQALREDPERHPLQRRLDEVGKPVNLQDWWLPYLYVQRSLVLQPAREEQESWRSVSISTAQQPSRRSSASSTYEFTGRSAELLQIERSLLRKRIVVVSGFGGSGKTALAREVADWLTRTKMYDKTCFVSFEQGGDASVLLRVLGNVLAINDGSYHAYDPPAALAILAPVLEQRRVLIIADDVESILPGGGAALDDVRRNQLWEALTQLQSGGASVLITSRSTKLEDQRFVLGTQADYLKLKGLAPDDAYALAVQVLNAHQIDLASVPYADLCDLLAQLGHLPLAIQLILPALKEHGLTQIKSHFATLLSHFTDDTTTGRNKSLITSLEFSLQRLPQELQSLLPRLAPFEGGALELLLLDITQFPVSEWTTLRRALEQVALVAIEEGIRKDLLFLRFHPVLIPFLRTQPGSDEPELHQRYALLYAEIAEDLTALDNDHALTARWMVGQELPNFKRALNLLLEAGKMDEAARLAFRLVRFLKILGLWRQREAIQQLISSILGEESSLTQAVFLREAGAIEDEYARGELNTAYRRALALLTRIEVQPSGSPFGPDSYYCFSTLSRIAALLSELGQFEESEQRYHEALTLIGSLIEQEPDNQELILSRGSLLNELSDVLRDQGRYPEAETLCKEALEIAIQQSDLPAQANATAQMGLLALLQGNLLQAQEMYKIALALYKALGDTTWQAKVWHQLGNIAMEQKDWMGAEQYYRQSLAFKESLGNAHNVAMTYSSLARLAIETGRPAEAEHWFKLALDLYEREFSGTFWHANALINMAEFWKTEVQRGQFPVTLLNTAKHYAEQALTILQRLNVETWRPLEVLAYIAEQEGQLDIALNYHRRAREAFAAHPGNRHQIDTNSWYATFINRVARAALRDIRALVYVERLWLPKLEAMERGQRMAEPVRRILDGERSWDMLAEGLEPQEALVLLRILETIAQLQTAWGISEELTQRSPYHIVSNDEATVISFDSGETAQGNNEC